MHLKSLVLKGFKSFADRSVLTLEPGITVIVGPNGSGKSNISDAVLWVLGERSARNLRGQAMDDIIFSGSAARKAVSVAEVELVLDNSDGTLPVEFDEVAIARRMYRSGESEYLVNGVVARRLDVLDILHDTGLGTGTHSIISQGSLDSILQSKPEDRRALIEEAAGVLKHKQRKEKSARKLEAMDNHLHRVRDVAAEVARQLGPLARKAKRAQAYQEVSAELAEVKLALAVDNLRTLQEQWERVCAAEKSLADEVAERRESVSSAEQKVSDYQELMRRESQDAGELAKRQRRAAYLTERLDSAELLMRERRRAAIESEADMRTQIDSSAARRVQVQRELDQAKSQFEEASTASASADGDVISLSSQKSELDGQLREALEALDSLSAEIRACEDEIESAQKNRALLQEDLANGLAHVKLVEARKNELASNLERVRAERDDALAAAEAAREILDDLGKREALAQQDFAACLERREKAVSDLDAAKAELRLAESEERALVQALAANEEDEPALAWLIEHADEFGASSAPLSSSIKVGASSLEPLVESLLGEDLAALAVNDAAAAQSIAQVLSEGGRVGGVSLVVCGDAGSDLMEHARKCAAGHALADGLDYPRALAPVVEALLGDVVVCDDRAKAFAAHARDDWGLRFASPDGCVIWPSGKVRVYGAPKPAEEGVLARERRLDEVRQRRDALAMRVAQAEGAMASADAAYRAAQAESLELSRELANQKGAYAAAEAEGKRRSERLTAMLREAEDIDQQVRRAKQSVDELRPGMADADKLIAQLESSRAQLTAARDDATREVDPLRARASLLSEQLSDAKLAAATFAERKVYASRIADARALDISAIDRDVTEARRLIAVKARSAQRGQEMLEVIERLAGGLLKRARTLDEAVNASESGMNSVHADATSARDAARKAHDDYDDASARMSQARVEKSRLEVQVEAAVAAVVRDCATPLDIAEQLPQLENRAEAEDEMLRLERRIKNMGTINPDAAEEYAQLKNRYDFLAGQLSDMEAARHALERITRVIDTRMKDDFARTFEQVNANFNEVFSLLFPGGSAHLSLEDPDDVDNSGVEVTAQPRGKRLTKMMLMSGGEKSLTALALLFAVYKTRSTPFYILDEVEAALDDTNLRRLISYIDTLRSSTQLIMITHQRRTMEMADVLFGVSMQADGVTKVISQKLDRALEQSGHGG